MSLVWNGYILNILGLVLRSTHSWLTDIRFRLTHFYIHMIHGILFAIVGLCLGQTNP